MKKLKIGTQSADEYKTISSPLQRAAANVHLRKLAAHAKQAFQLYSTASKDANAADKAGIQAELIQAAYGPQATDKTPKPAVTLDVSGAWAAGCGPDAASRSVVGDLYCMCTSTESGQAAACSAAFTYTQWSGAQTSNFPSKAASLIQSCGKTTLDQLTAADVTAAIGNFVAVLRFKASGSQRAACLGQAECGACDGTSSKLCVDYSKYFTTTAEGGYSKIPWVQSLLSAKTKLQARERQQSTIENTANQITGLLEQAKAVYHAAVAGELVTANTERQAAKTQPEVVLKESEDSCNKKEKMNANPHASWLTRIVAKKVHIG
uniref:Variant surface glycoprotein n=1 Tax=Trypanosoma brucei TaxID=5691 RepID=A0A1V0FYD7_9TRYP|nr:variant surface glycoprotein [Trypanosoma brucei]